MGAGEVRLPQAGQSGLPGKSSVVLEAGRLRQAACFKAADGIRLTGDPGGGGGFELTSRFKFF